MSGTSKLILEVDKVLPVLNEISLFGGLTESQLYTIFNLLEMEKVRKGDVIFRQGGSPSSIYIVLSGRIKIVADMEEDPKVIITFEKGQCFGETAAIGIMPHVASAVACEDSELIVISRESILNLFKTDKDLFGILILNIAREACRRLHKADELLLHYSHKPCK